MNMTNVFTHKDENSFPEQIVCFETMSMMNVFLSQWSDSYLSVKLNVMHIISVP